MPQKSRRIETQVQLLTHYNCQANKASVRVLRNLILQKFPIVLTICQKFSRKNPLFIGQTLFNLLILGAHWKTVVMTKSTKPYNIREKQDKNAAYRSLIRAELADELYEKILNIVVIQKRYRDKDFSAKELAQELGTNTRYISAVINSRFNTNFSCLINEYRVKEALHRMTDKRYLGLTIEEIGSLVGFANRQSFYASFYRIMGETPNGYRKRHTEIK